MATTRKTRPGTDLELAAKVTPGRHPESAPTDTKGKATEALKRFALPLYVAICGLVAWAALWTSAMSTGPFGKLSYPDTLGRIVGIYAIAIVLPAAFLMVIRRNQRYSYTLIRAIALVASVLISFFVLPVVVRLFGIAGFAQALNALAGVPAVLALAFHGWFAILLAKYKEDDGTLSANQREVTDLDARLHTAEQAYQDAEATSSRHKARLEQTQRNIAALAEESKSTSKAVESARAAYNGSAAMTALRDAETDRDKKRAAYDALLGDIDELKKAERTEKNAEDRRHITDELADKRARRDELAPFFRTGEANLDRKIEDLRKAAENSDEQRQLEAAEAAHQSKTSEMNEARSDESRHKVKAKKSSEAAADKAQILEDLKARHAELTDSTETANKADRSVWRDIVFPLVATFAAALVCYPAWQGYVMTLVR